MKQPLSEYLIVFENSEQADGELMDLSLGHAKDEGFVDGVNGFVKRRVLDLLEGLLRPYHDLLSVEIHESVGVFLFPILQGSNVELLSKNA